MSQVKKLKIPKGLEQNVRMQSLYIVYQVLYKQGYSNLLIKDANVKEIDRNLLAEIVYGTLSEYNYLDYQLQPFVKKVKKLDLWVRVLLLTALFQLTRLDRVPTHAIVNESVEIAKKVGNPGIAKFVNGVLREVCRQGVRDLSEITDDVRRLSIQTSMPKWLIEKLIDSYSLEEIENLGDSLKEPSHVSARINDKSLNQSVILKELEAEGYQVKASEVSPVGVVGKKGFLAGSNLFKEGKLTIQDESSMLVAPALDVKEDSLVLDACAAPGGKTTHIASYLDSGKVIALDIHKHKLKLIQDNARRLGVSEKVETKLLDARKAQSEFEPESFDRILVDAPCSGLGLMRRKPELRFGKTLQDIKNLSEIQQNILNEVAPLLKKGGKLVYSTCTIVPDENKEVINSFLKEHQEFEIIEVPGLELIPKAKYQKMCVLLPHMYHTDGFFISCLQKKGG